ncbi:MAG TPA: hypothetical protein P5121_22165 [Caldilineaceae bacterium]|nr:hypothetical protein [Caldilineaceae bacterium]
MSTNDNTNNLTSIDTGGGPAISGDVNISGGDFVARDKLSFTEEVAYSVHGLENPYLGLRAFGYRDRDIYAGRDAKIAEALAKLTTPGQEQAVLFVTGASGSGKSSFVQAGLLPQLEAHYAQRHTNVRIAIFRPRDQPLAQLDDALRQLAPDAGRDLAACTAAHQVNLLVIDQFEEVFTQAHLPVDAEFFQWLQGVPSFHMGRTHIIATIRSDYLNELFNVAELYDLNRNGLDLRAMREDELREAIQRPLQVRFPNGDRRFEPALVQTLAQDAGANPTLLPLLQVTLQTVWKRGSLRLAAYTNLTDAIQQRAEAVYAFRDHDEADPETPRPPHEQQELMQILLDLIHVAIDESDRRDVRQPRMRRELEGNAPHRPQLIEELVTARLLAATRESVNGEDVDVVDIIHESLIDNWERLQAAIDEQRQQLQRRARFQLWLGEWLRNGQQDGYLLLTDMQLAEARALVEAQDIEVQGAEAQAFYRRSVDYYHAAQRRRIRNIWLVAIVMALLFLGAVATASYSAWLNSQLETKNTQLDDKNDELEQTNIQLNDSITQLDQTVSDLDATNYQLQQTISVAFSRQLAAQSTSELSKSRYEPAILLAVAAGQSTDTSEAFSAIRAAIAHPWHSLLVFYGHTGDIYQVIWNQDESKLLTSSADDTARIWDAATGAELVRLDGHTSYVYQATWSQDESKILTHSDDHTARIWDATTGGELVRLDGHTSYIFQATWSQNSFGILTLNDDNTARIWDSATGQELIRLDGHASSISQATWSQDESRILSRSEDNTVRIWDAATGNELVRLDGHTNYVTQATWSQDESKILTGSYDGTVRIWDTATGDELIRLDGHINTVYQATWSQDGSRILTRSEDNTVRIWDAATGNELVRLDGHTEFVTQATWRQDESRVLTSSDDNTARIWDAATGEELVRLDGHTGDVRQATWSQDESKVLTSSDDDTARIWDVATGEELVRLEGHTDSVYRATWSQDESRILTASDDGTVRIWYTHMSDLLVAACEWAPRNFTWSEWSTYMADNVGTYRPTCPNAPIPPDAIAGIQDEVRQLIRDGEIDSATERLEELNGWLQVNGQFKNYGVDVEAFVAEATATSDAP